MADTNTEIYIWLFFFLILFVGAVFFGPKAIDYINHQWPQQWTQAVPNRQIHPDTPKSQESHHENKISSLFHTIQFQCLQLFHYMRNLNHQEGEGNDDIDGHNSPTAPKIYQSPSQQHNHRPLSPFQQLQHTSGTSPNSGMFTRSKSFNNPNNNLNNISASIIDRLALEKFFQSTHLSDSDWINESTGSGRSNWLDKEKSIDRWQGITLHINERNTELFGRVEKFQLPKNNISGPIDCLLPLTGMFKLSLWQNSLTGTLHGVSKMALLRQLDLSKNKLNGSLEPLIGLNCLEELNLGYNMLEGSVDAIGKLKSIARLVLCDNNFEGTLDGFAPVKTFQSIDVCNNVKLFGQLPPKLHQRWISGKLPINTSGTNIGAASANESYEHLKVNTKNQRRSSSFNRQNSSGSIPSSPSSPKTPTQLFIRSNSSSRITPSSSLSSSSQTSSTSRPQTPSTPQLQRLQNILIAQQSFNQNIQRASSNSSPRSQICSPSQPPLPSSPSSPFQLQRRGSSTSFSSPTTPLPRPSSSSVSFQRQQSSSSLQRQPSSSSLQRQPSSLQRQPSSSSLQRQPSFSSRLFQSSPSSVAPVSPSSPTSSSASQGVATRMLNRSNTAPSNLLVVDIDIDNHHEED